MSNGMDGFPTKFMRRGSVKDIMAVDAFLADQKTARQQPPEGRFHPFMLAAVEEGETKGAPYNDDDTIMGVVVATGHTDRATVQQVVIDEKLSPDERSEIAEELGDRILRLEQRVTNTPPTPERMGEVFDAIYNLGGVELAEAAA